MGCSQSKGSSEAVVSNREAVGVNDGVGAAGATTKEAAKKEEVKKKESQEVGSARGEPIPTPPSSKAASPVPAGGRDDDDEDSAYSYHVPGYSSGASTPTGSVDGRNPSGNERNGLDSARHGGPHGSKMVQSSSILGLDDMIQSRKEEGDFKSNIVHIEVPFGKPIEDVYEGVHNGPVLGSGISGLVRLVTHKATGVKYAVKCLDLGLIDTEEGLQQLREEIYIMCQLDHPNIVRLEEVYESESEIYLVQELCLGGELFDRLDEQPDYHYTEAQCARLVKQMLCSVRYIHSKGIIHRDLKLENFLFSDTSPDSELKMIDFGLSKHFKFGEVQHEAVGTPYTVAPEVIRGSYDERCDVWAIGVITFLLLSGDPPFGGCGGPEPLMTVRANILKGSFAFEPDDIWCNVSTQARTFITSLLVTDPNKRPTAREAQKSQWLRTNNGRKHNDNKLNPGVVRALVNFKEYSDMRKLLCEVLSFTLLPDQIQELRKEFEKMDTDGSGEISLTALKQVLMGTASSGSLGALNEEEVEDIFNAMRVRKTETTIHWHEFIAAGLSQCKVDDRNLRLAFDRLDSDHKGYITFDNVMDLMGNDAMQSEDAMRIMWGDSMKACNCKHAIITYEDFLLLMKGQTKEVHDVAHDPAMHLSSNTAMALGTLPEVQSHDDGHTTDDNTIETRDSHDVGLASKQTHPAAKTDICAPSNSNAAANTTPPTQPALFRRNSLERRGSGSFIPSIPAEPPQSPSPQTNRTSLSAPTTPMSDNLMPPLGDDSDGPLMMDDEEMDEMISAAADRNAQLTLESSSSSFLMSAIPSPKNLTPPQSPKRGAPDYITPMSNRPSLSPDVLKNGSGSGNLLPLLPLGDDAGPNSSLIRRRSRSVDDQDKLGSSSAEDIDREPHFNADARRAMLLPEHTHDQGIDDLIKDENQTPLVINRTLYRAHRQMRLAVMEASKRFEEEQTRRTLESLKAQKEAEGGRKIQTAGLVMRHGFQKEISRESLRKLMEQKQEEQRQAVEKATRRGGRGRRKKTVSDMAGMLSSPPPESLIMEPDTLGFEKSAPSGMNIAPPVPVTNLSRGATDSKVSRPIPTKAPTPPPPTEPKVEHRHPQLREPTTPGVFRKTFDPFGIGDSGHGTGRWVPPPRSASRNSSKKDDLDGSTNSNLSEPDLQKIMEGPESPPSPDLNTLYGVGNNQHAENKTASFPPPPPL